MRVPPHPRFDQVRDAPETIPSVDYSQELTGYRFEGVSYAASREAAQAQLDHCSTVLDRARLTGTVADAAKAAREIQVEFDQLAYEANVAGVGQDWLNRMATLASRVRDFTGLNSSTGRHRKENPA